MLKLLNPLSEKGDYSYSGTPIVSNRVSFLLSQKQVRFIIFKIKEYTKNQNRDYILTFKDDTNDEQIYVVDNLSQSDLDELKADSNASSQHLTALNHYCIIYEGELPII